MEVLFEKSVSTNQTNNVHGEWQRLGGCYLMPCSKLSPWYTLQSIIYLITKSIEHIKTLVSLGMENDAHDISMRQL